MYLLRARRKKRGLNIVDGKLSHVAISTYCLQESPKMKKTIQNSPIKFCKKSYYIIYNYYCVIYYNYNI